MRLSISRTLLGIFLILGPAALAAVLGIGGWLQTKSINSLAHDESRRHAETIFQNLYTVMRKGWSKDEIADLIIRLNKANPDVAVAVHRTEQVAWDFGDIEADRIARTEDPLIAAALATRSEQLRADDHSLRFIYPILVAPECLDCHVSAQTGTVNGIIDIRVPLAKLRVPLEYALHSVIAVFGALIALLFTVTLVIVRAAVAHPIHRLARLIDDVTKAGDLSRRVDDKELGRLYEVRSLTGNFNRLMAELEASRSELVLRSATDALTGLSNRRRFDDQFHQELERANRHSHKLSIIMIDLDGFKPINDKYGHAAGDDMLRLVADCLRRHVRANDLAARVGGDEFIILAPETGRAGAQALGRKLADSIQAEALTIDGDQVSAGASIGIACYPENGDDSHQLLIAADAAMYENKRARKALRAAF